jgi:hypothetical protein
MANPMLPRRVVRAQGQQAKPPESAGLGLVPFPHVEAGDCSFLSAHDPLQRHLLPDETPTTLMEPEEVLIADPRGDLTPVQMMEQKLQALVARAPPGRFTQTRSVKAGQLVGSLIYDPMRQEATEALCRSGQKVVPALVKAVKHSNNRIREEAAQVLKRIDPAAGVK